MAFRRDLVNETGLLDEKYRFYRHLDLDFSLAARTLGYRLVIDTGLPVVRHEHLEWAATPEEERDRLSKRNFYRFLRKWGERSDLLVVQARYPPSARKRSSSEARTRRCCRRMVERTAAMRDSKVWRIGVQREGWPSIGTVQRRARAAQERPAPKLVRTILSPSSTRPDAIASHNAIGIDAALVLP